MNAREKHANYRRAVARGRMALEEYAQRAAATSGDPDDISDLLTDLVLYAHGTGADPHELLARIARHVAEETDFASPDDDDRKAASPDA